jgi:hypothetical protein
MFVESSGALAAAGGESLQIYSFGRSRANKAAVAKPPRREFG